MNKKKIITGVALLWSLLAMAQGPNGSGTYYEQADGLKAKDLKTALCGIIAPHTELTYSELWTAYKSTDVTADGYIWDMYSSATKYTPGGSAQGANYTKEGDSYNREHTLPKSWFGKATPMYTDLFHVMPTDGYVNSRRSNYPYGEVGTASYKSEGDFCRLGTCSLKGYSGIVFEPADEYKGDLARNYFYMATAYEDKVASWSSAVANQGSNASNVMSGDSYTAYVKWTLDMLLRWAKNDPVSQKEIDRNNAVYAIQHNRNPYIDYPGLEQYVWGAMTDAAFSYDHYVSDITWSDTATVYTSAGSSSESGSESGGTGGTTESGEATYEMVQSASDLVSGGTYLLAYAKSAKALSDYGTVYNGVNVNISNNIITTATGKGLPHTIVLGGSEGAWTLYDSVDGKYIALLANKNGIAQSNEVNANSQWTIKVSSDATTITSNAFTNRQIQWNTSSPRFACYTGTQQPVNLYKCTTPTGVKSPEADADGYWLDVYTLDGRMVKHHVRIENAFMGLAKGVYVIDHKKFVVR